MARQLAQHGEMRVTAVLLEQLERISISTVRHILKRIGQDQRHRRRRPRPDLVTPSNLPELQPIQFCAIMPPLFK